MSGVFQINRDIFKNDIWTNVAEFRVFIYILGNAVWKEDGIMIGGIHVSRGQYIRSYRNLREDLVYEENNAIKYYSLSTIKRITDNLVADGRLEKEETRLGTLFTVTNYSKYQGFARFDDTTKNAERTERERRENNKNKDNKDNKDNYIYIVECLNKKTGKNFSYKTKATQSKINARLEEGFTLKDFIKVINIKSSEWLNDANMQKYLRPETLFGTKFESYLNQMDENLKNAPKERDPYQHLKVIE